MKEKIKIPEGVQAKVEDSVVVVSGKLGELKRRLIKPNIKIEVKNNEIIFSSELDNKNTKRLINTFVAHVENMVKGVTRGFTYKMKAVYTHFPMTVKVEGEKIRIDNFIGERSPRYAKKLPGVEVKVQKQDITLTGIDKEAISQTASNIEQATRVIGRDRRVFQDGIYITEKGK